MKIFEGKLVSHEIKIGIVAARFNEFITSKLLSGAVDGLLRHDVKEEDIHVAWVRSFAVQPAIMIMYAMRFQREFQPYRWKAESLCCSVFSRPRIWNRPLSGRVQKPGIKAMTAR